MPAVMLRICTSPRCRVLGRVGDEVTHFYDILTVLIFFFKELYKRWLPRGNTTLIYISMASISFTAFPPSSIAFSTLKILSLQPAIRNTSSR